ncbi:hypothetical protein GCM10010916_37710 [Paenibacillus abyssi]|uniref:Uncharacterized protein n=1 Tax=Paenibacillus abyssi TaxID=1340531 RepID=A0A917G0W0_9BACL|nr:hypothetical protein GCM10010916_37710 [Paenibacillus abyssi]
METRFKDDGKPVYSFYYYDSQDDWAKTKVDTFNAMIFTRAEYFEEFDWKTRRGGR